MIWPRWLAWLAAKMGGFFWIPCPVCRNHFAGFEASWEHVNHRVEGGELVSEVTCSKPACIEAGKRDADEFYQRMVERRREDAPVIRLRP